MAQSKVNPKRAVASKRLPMHLCPPTLIIEVARVMDACGDKADPTRYAYNWRDSETSLTDYINAIKRHLAALEDGQWNDPKSGRPHLAHIASGCGIALDSEKAGTLVKDTSEKSCGVAEQLQEYEDTERRKECYAQLVEDARQPEPKKYGIFWRPERFPAEVGTRSQTFPDTFENKDHALMLANTHTWEMNNEKIWFVRELTSSES